MRKTMKKYLLITLVLILLQACVNETVSSRRGIYVTKSNQHALVIGIDEYQHLTNLKGAVNDANLLAKTLRNKNINLPNNRVLLNEQATRKAFLNAWQDMLQAANPGDRLILTYAGHGGRIPDQPPLGEADGHDETLMFHDFNSDNPNQGMLIDDDMYGMLKQASANYKLVLLLDACHSSGATRSNRSAGTYTMMRGGKTVSIADKIEDNKLPNNVTVITAVQHDGLEVEEVHINNQAHGALSWAFAEALKSNKNSLTRKQLNDFLLETVRDKTNNQQFPKLKPEADDTIVIKLNSNPAQTPNNKLTIKLKEQREIHKQGDFLHFTIDSTSKLTDLTVYIKTYNKNISLLYPTEKHHNKLKTLPYYLTIEISPPYGKDKLVAILCPETPTELQRLLEQSIPPTTEHTNNCQVGEYSFVSSE
jgi:hypothetical protein